ncbi:CoA transferase [Lacibacterium aquatile]|uniref:CoA transferase n=1 Tax=Lacibacterium aquatile TaxID=1168082 RepID=A0ABW5DRD3_9PROT
MQKMMSDVAGALLGLDASKIQVDGDGSLPSAFSVSDLAAASIGMAGLAAADLAEAAGGARAMISVDRRLASFWFASSLRPEGWALPPIWDPVAGDYPTADGWIRLHTNAPHHRAAALTALGGGGDREAVAAAVRGWPGETLEAAVVAGGGCAAFMRSQADWQAHPQGRAVAAEDLIAWQTVGAQPWRRPLEPTRPLRGVRVLDLTRVLAGPVATRFLAWMGADVLRIDPPDWDEPAVVPEIMQGKRSTRLDLKSAAGRERLLALMADADILVHGYRQEALAGLGLGQEARRAINPGLIEVCLTAYGWSGPWSGRRGFDSLVQMSCGIADTGQRIFGKDRPTPLPVQALDHATGYLMAAAALRGVTERIKTGRVMQARLSLARTAALLMAYPQQESRAFEPENAADIDPAIEMTGWGAARRLRMPLAIDGLRVGSDLPAMSLGSYAPEWSQS